VNFQEVFELKTDSTTKLYEGMFLVDSVQAATDWDGITSVIKGLLEKAGAEIVALKKWDERKLTYNIKGKSRGTYVLTYFKVTGDKIQQIEHDALLTEQIIRFLILTADHLTAADIDKPTPLMLAATQPPPAEAPEAAEKPRRETGVPSIFDEPTEEIEPPRRSYY
jgi:small subunit ribosomal protein S6